MNKEIITLDKISMSIKYLCQKDKRFAKVFSLVGKITYSPYSDIYAFVIHEIIEQMLSTNSATKIYERLENLCNGKISVENINLLSDEEIKSFRTSSSKVRYIRAFTDAVLKKTIDLENFKNLSDDEVIKNLTSILGIGRWTAKMVLIFCLNRQDVLPYEDVAFLQAHGWVYKTDDFTPKAVQVKCRKGKPYSSIAARYMYKVLEMGFTKEGYSSSDFTQAERSDVCRSR